MLASQLLNNVKNHIKGSVCSRNIGILAPAMQKATDPIQQLFVDKLREYRQKSGGYVFLLSLILLDSIVHEYYSGNKLVEASPELERELKAELEKVAKQYGSDGQDMTKFPTFKFQDPVIDPINLEK